MSFEKELAALKEEMARIDSDLEATKRNLGVSDAEIQELSNMAKQGKLEPELKEMLDKVEAQVKRDGSERAARFKKGISEPKRNVSRQGAMRI